MQAGHNDVAKREARLGEVLAALLEAAEGGSPPDRGDWLGRHPEFRVELNEFFASEDHLRSLTAPLRAAVAVDTPVPGTTLSGGGTPQRAGQCFGDYELLEEIGRGGMGVVYRARQKGANRVVALKLLRPDPLGGQEQARRFRNEAEIVARLDHPNIVPLYEVGEDAGHVYFSMKLVEGGGLDERLDRFAAEPRAAASVVAAVARAVHHAHQRGVLHRDLKPSNILLGEDGRPYVTDFGLARRLEAGGGLTQSGALVGTPNYMAPEQAAGHRAGVTTATDVYGLGAVLYTLLAGRPPFQGESLLDTLAQIKERDPEPPSRHGRRVDRDLETICLKCLRKEPGKRYASAGALADDLARFSAGEPIRARPVGPWERGLKWARRRPTAAALLAVSVLALLGLLGTAAAFTVYLQQALAERTDQLRQEQRQRERDLKDLQYLLDVRLAAQAGKEGRLGDGRELLRRHQPAERMDEPDRRGFEWRYLWRLCDRERVAFQGQGQAVTCAAFSPDLEALATGAWDGTILLWDVATGQRRADLRAHTGVVHAVAFTPDGSALVSAGGDGVLSLWDVARRRERAKLVLGPRAARCLAISPDGKTLAAGGEDGVVKSWDLGSLKECRPPIVCGQHVVSLAFAPDGATVAIGLYPGAGMLVEARTGRTLHRCFAGGAPWGSSFSPDSRTLASAGNTVWLWDVATGVRVGTLGAEGDRLVCVAFSRDGRFVAGSGWDGVVRLWDAANGKLQALLGGHLGEVVTLTFSPDGSTLASAAADRMVRLWSTATRPACVPLDVPLTPAGPVAFAPDGRTLALADRDRSVKLLDVSTGKVTRRFLGHYHDLIGVHLGPDGRSLVTADEGGLVRVRDLATGKEQHLFTCAFGLQRGAFSPDGRRLASIGSSVVFVWNLATGKELFRWTEAGGIQTVALAPDGKTLLTKAGLGRLRRWNIETGVELPVVSADSVDWVITGLAFAPDGRLFATSHGGGTVHLYDAGSGKPLAALRREKAQVRDANYLAFSPDSQTLVVAGNRGDVDVWDVRARALRNSIGSSHGQARGLSVSPDGKTFALVSGEGGVCLWDGRRWFAQKPEGQPPRPVRALAFSPDGKVLATASRYGTSYVRSYLGKLCWDHTVPAGDDVRLWDVASRRELATLPDQRTFGVEAVAFTPDGRTLLAGGTDGSVTPWEVGARRGGSPAFQTAQARKERGKWERCLTLGLPMRPTWDESIWQVAVAPGGKLLATGGSAGTVKLWDLPGLRERATLLTGSGKSACVAFSPDGASLATAVGPKVLLWDAEEGTRRRELSGQLGEVLALAFSPDGKWLATGVLEGPVTLWDLEGGRPMVLKRHRGPAAALDFSPDGRTLASGGWDGTIRLWRVSDGQELLSLAGHRGKVLCVRFSPDGRTLASGGETAEGGELYLWQAAR
jgi:WD40 repeat protein/predicted Ser/Thr protein kinase